MEDIGNPDDSREALKNAILSIRRNDRFWRVLARTLLDGLYNGDVQTEFPFLRRHVERIRKDQTENRLSPGEDPRVLVAGGVALVLGLLVFENYLLPGTNLDRKEDPEVLDQIISTWMNVWRRKDETDN
jgi:hypothetical protein